MGGDQGGRADDLRQRPLSHAAQGMAASSLTRWLLRLLAGVSGLGALGAALLFVQAAQRPYNEQGRHFEAGVVHDAQAIGVYGGVALVMGLLTLFLVWLARRLG